jgi:hypothetical protein
VEHSIREKGAYNEAVRRGFYSLLTIAFAGMAQLPPEAVFEIPLAFYADGSLTPAGAYAVQPNVIQNIEFRRRKEA